MCTAAVYRTKDTYFGRTLDYEFSYGDEVTITPRNYPLKFRHIGAIEKNYAILGMAHVVGNYPLYYDAINEKGLGMAGLNFVGNAVYQELSNEKKNVAQYEFILWILRQCATVQEAKDCLVQMQLVGTPFHESLPTAAVHKRQKETIRTKPEAAADLPFFEETRSMFLLLPFSSCIDHCCLRSGVTSVPLSSVPHSFLQE